MDILLVEDAEVVRGEIESLLHELSVVEDVLAVEGGTEAREALERRAFDVWVLDFQLDDGTAVDLLAECRTGPAEVIIVTNHPTPIVRERCLQAGADWFFDKSADFGELLVAVESAAAPLDIS